MPKEKKADKKPGTAAGSKPTPKKETEKKPGTAAGKKPVK